MKQNEYLVWRTAQGKDENRRTILRHQGENVTVPENWVFVPSGDPALTRRLKASGDYWVQVHQRKNRTEAQGIWTDSGRIETIRQKIEAEHKDPAYLRKLEAGRARRAKEQKIYEYDFKVMVKRFLAFAPCFAEMEERLAQAVTAHAIPVGSGTVARTERIPIEQRAEAAVIAWMRHQTTAYDHMRIVRIRGERREVRRMLAEQSRKLLENYRNGKTPDPACPLRKALGITEEREKRKENE